jgi:hypothetical protein
MVEECCFMLVPCLELFSSLKTEKTYSSETSVGFLQTTGRYISEYGILLCWMCYFHAGKEIIFRIEEIGETRRKINLLKHFQHVYKVNNKISPQFIVSCSYVRQFLFHSLLCQDNVSLSIFSVVLSFTLILSRISQFAPYFKH